MTQVFPEKKMSLSHFKNQRYIVILSPYTYIGPLQGILEGGQDIFDPDIVLSAVIIFLNPSCSSAGLLKNANYI